jgi:outer membrane lipoprotein
LSETQSGGLVGRVDIERRSIEMRGWQRTAMLLAAVFIVGCLGCATYPISDQYRASASKNVNFTMALRNPDAYVGAVVIWGGRIVETDNVPGGSEIVVLETPLMGWEEPSAPEYSPGRFIAKTADFLDPAIYKPGKRITLAGEITGGTTRPLGTTEYTYPVVAIKQLHLWTEEKMYAYEPVDYWPWWLDVGWVYDSGHWQAEGHGDRDRGHGEEGRGGGGHEGGGHDRK